MDTILIDANNVTHRFDYLLFEGVDLRLAEGEALAVVGRSGSGKSTLLHNLSGFLPPVSGRVKLLGKEIYALDEPQRERMRRYDLGIVFQSHYLFKGLGALENVELASMLSGRPVRRELLERLEIGDVMGLKASELSGGQQQRVSIARVLTKRPRVIFADEPTGNLDRESADLVMEVLLEYIRREGAALFMVTHDPQIARRCDRVMRLEEGCLRETQLQ